MGKFESSLIVFRIWSYCTVSLQIVFYFCIWLYCTVSLRIVFCLCSCWFVLELVFSSTVCLAVLSLLGSICLKYVNRFLFGVSRSKILHCSLLQATASTEREWISLAPPISVDDPFFEDNMFWVCCVDFDIICRFSVPSVEFVSYFFDIDLCFTAWNTEEAIKFIVCGVVFDKGRGVSTLVIKSDPS